MAVVAGAMLLLVAVGTVGAQEAQPADKPAAAQTGKKQTVCPIMGGPVNSSIYADANGKRVYFCCGGCPATFRKDPAKYIAKLEKDGVTLEKTPAAAPASKQPGDAAAIPATGHATMGCGDGCCK
jgi:YHS domain-containing protein